MFVFAFYDILYKFSIAAIFYYTALSIQDKKISTSEIIKKGTLESINFPSTYKAFIDEYNEKLKGYTNNILRKHHKLISSLKDKLDVFGIYMEIPNKLNKDHHQVDDFQHKMTHISNLIAKVREDFMRFKNTYLILSDEN